MSIITVSRGCYSHGKEIAEKIAERLGYECVDNKFLMGASEYFNVPEIQLMKTFHDPPSFFQRLTHGRDTFMAYIRAALLDRIKKDSVVYHGYAGHLLLSDVPCVFKVRVQAQMPERIRMISRLKQLSREEAIRQIEEEDRQRAKWTRAIYREDLNDPHLYDLVVQIGPMTIPDACDVICNAAASPAYQIRDADRRKIEDLAVAGHVSAILQAYDPIDVISEGGNVRVVLPPQKIKKSDFSTPQVVSHLKDRVHDDLVQEVVERVRKVPGVRQVVCDIDMPLYS
jgi:cytidylate kinase